MRKLTVVRRKQFVASAMKVRICINTDGPGDITLKHTDLIVLGSIKNGETITVDIPEESVEVYVVYDKLFPQNFKDLYRVESGSEDLTLHTFSRRNFFKGNPFVISSKNEMTKQEIRLHSLSQGKKEKSYTTTILFFIVFFVFMYLGYKVGFSLASK